MQLTNTTSLTTTSLKRPALTFGIKLLMMKPVNFGLGQLSVGKIGSIGILVEAYCEGIIDTEVLIDIWRK